MNVLAYRKLLKSNPLRSLSSKEDSVKVLEEEEYG